MVAAHLIETHEVLPSRLDCETSVSVIYSVAAQDFLQLVVPVLPNLRIVGALLVDVEPEDVGKVLVVMFGRQHRVRDQLFSCDKVLEVVWSVKVGLQLVLWQEVRLYAAIHLFLEQTALHALLELAVLKAVHSHSHFHLQHPLEVQVLGLAQHLQSQLHGHLGVLLHHLEARLCKGTSLRPQMLHDLLHRVPEEAALDQVLVPEDFGRLGVEVDHSRPDSFNLVHEVVGEDRMSLLEVGILSLRKRIVYFPEFSEVVEVGDSSAGPLLHARLDEGLANEWLVKLASLLYEVLKQEVVSVLSSLLNVQVVRVLPSAVSALVVAKRRHRVEEAGLAHVVCQVCRVLPLPNCEARVHGVVSPYWVPRQCQESAHLFFQTTQVVSSTSVWHKAELDFVEAEGCLRIR